jgi:hypothetical protein
MPGFTNKLFLGFLKSMMEEAGYQDQEGALLQGNITNSLHWS